MKPLYKKNLFIRKLFTHLVGIQPFPHSKTSLYENLIGKIKEKPLYKQCIVYTI